MLIVKQDVINNWLKAAYQNQTWLAAEMGFTKSYLSQILNNRCKISTEVICRLCRITHIPFQELFYDDGKIDTREFYGDVYCVDGEAMRVVKYKEYIDKIKRGHTQK